MADAPVIVFDNLVAADRDFGSNETITAPAPRAIAKNAPGDLASPSLEEIEVSSNTHAQNISSVFASN